MTGRLFYALAAVALLTTAQARGQSAEGYFSNSKPESIYDYTEAFDHNFYTRAGGPYRSASGKPGHAYWQNRADYEISVTLDDQKNEISGTEILTYTNNSPDSLDFLWLQLDQNLFKSDSRGTMMIPLSGSRSGAKGQAYDAGFRIRHVELIAADGKGQDLSCMTEDTRMQLLLPVALQPRGQVKLRIEYSYIIPFYGADRTGIAETDGGKIFSVAQWYPRMCVYDDISGWNTDPYNGLGEFYLEYGNFDVRITAPADHVVVCSGQLLNPSEVYTAQELKAWENARRSDRAVLIRDGRPPRQGKAPLTWHYRMDNTRDIAWASSAAFIVDAARINLPDGTTAMAISAYPRGADSKSGWRRSTEYVKASIEHYSAKWYQYPYPVAVNVASSLTGMEYPGLAFCSLKEKGAGLWSVTDHEMAHNWFPMIVGTNERRHGWMDEGLNTFINYLSAESFNGGEYKEGDKDMHKWARVFADDRMEPVKVSADNMKEDNSGMLIYLKPALGLLMLRNQILGEERFDRALRAYIRSWAFKHPTPDDFFRTIENVAGEDLSWFWRGWFLKNWKMDQAITNVSYNKNNPQNGALITIANLQKVPMPVIVEVTTKAGEVSRIKLPVEIWKRGAEWKFLFPSKEELATVTLDPDHVLPDCNTSNNSWKVR